MYLNGTIGYNLIVLKTDFALLDSESKNVDQNIPSYLKSNRNSKKSTLKWDIILISRTVRIRFT